MTRREVREALEAAERAFGLTDEPPAFSLSCPGCDGRVDVQDASSLPMSYECFRCAAVYEIESIDDDVEISHKSDM